MIYLNFKKILQSTKDLNFNQLLYQILKFQNKFLTIHLLADYFYMHETFWVILM